MNNKEKMISYLHELPCIWKSVGKLEMAMMRCKSTTSSKYITYDRKRIELMNDGIDKSSQIEMELKT